MKTFPAIAAAAAFVCAALALPALADGTLTAADLHARCAADMKPCADAVHWLEENTSACFLANVTEDQRVARVYRWLGNHPDKTGKDDNELAGFAVDALWPCR